jgi:two-component system OmpR family response regulator
MELQADGRAETKRLNRPANEQARIPIVDDDAEFRGMLVSYLEGQNMNVGISSSGDEMSRHIAARQPDLVLLDLRLHKENGLDLLRGLRSRSDVPIIIMTGYRHDEIDRVVGLELGADAYVFKPFGLRELLARIRAVLRRHEFGRNNSHEFGRDDSNEQFSGGYSFDGWKLDLKLRRLTDKGGEPVP